MKLSFTFKHLDRSESLEGYLAEGLEEAGKFLLRDSHATVTCSKQGHEFHIEVSVNTRERYFRADAFDEDPYVAADMALVKLERQFLKNRKVVQNHRRPEFSKQGRLEQMNDRFESPLRYRKAA